jgi:hypothetical protein
VTIAEILRNKADGLQKKIDHCFAPRLTNTRKRAEEAAHQRREGQTLKATQDVMRQVAKMHEDGTCPGPLRPWRHITEFQTAVSVVRSAERQKEEFGDRDGKCLARLTEEQKAVRALMQPTDPAAEKLHALMRDSVRWNIPGFFPTPRKVVERMLELADFLDLEERPRVTLPIGRAQIRVLEPSAGRGDIADVIREKHPEVSLTLIEYNHSLKEILCLKGYEVQTEDDFLDWHPVDGVLFDRILMNPPFEKFQDVDHVRRAYTFLKPGGRLVAIMSPGAFFRSEKKAQQFRDDFEDCKTIPLESGTFETTGVAARIIVIDKPESCDYCAEIQDMTADTEYRTKIDAERVTAEFASASQRRLDRGKKPITESPLFGGEAQYSLFS